MSEIKIADPLTKVTINLPISDAKYLARAGLAAASRDDITPVITGVLLSAVNGHVKAVATDRYRVHRATAAVEGVEDFPPFLIPGSALRWLVSNAAFFGRGMLPQTVTIELEPTAERVENPTGATASPEGKVTLTIREGDFEGASFVAHQTALIKGNFPPIEKLLDDALGATPDASGTGTLDLDFLAKCRALANYNGEKPKVYFVVSGKGSGQALVVYKHGEALIQKGRDE